jgi:hypothetical protein
MSNHHHPSRIDRDTADALLCGDPAARRAAGRLGEHLAAAAAPAYPAELAGRPLALAAFQAARLQPSPEQRRPSMTKNWLTKLLTAKVAALAAATVASGVAIAAGTGALPGPATDTPTKTPTAPAPDTGRPLGTMHATGRPSTTPSHPTPAGAASLPPTALVGLCHAYLAGAGHAHGKALDSPAFTALITAAGGRDNVDGYCTALLATPAGSAATHPGTPAKPTGAPTGHPTGPPATHPTGPPPSPPGH